MKNRKNAKGKNIASKSRNVSKVKKKAQVNIRHEKSEGFTELLEYSRKKTLIR